MKANSNLYDKQYLKSYKIISLLGKGSFGTVYKIQVGNDMFALKQINLDNTDNYAKYIKNEVKIISNLNNEYIVRYFESFKETVKDEKLINLSCTRLNIIMEYCDGGDLAKFIETTKKSNSFIKETKIINIFTQICKGSNYLHSNKILHRDLKCMNVFLCKNGKVKIGDFGVAKDLNKNSMANTFIGTPYYLSPEICEDKSYDESSDIWSLGCILYEILTLQKAFNSNSQIGLIKKIIKGKYEPIPKNIFEIYSKDLIYLIDKLLVKKPNERMRTDEILRFLDLLDKTPKLIEQNDIKRRPETSLPLRLSQNKLESAKRVRINPKNKKENQVVNIFIKIRQDKL
jgi:serine/threonine protein kinase